MPSSGTKTRSSPLDKQDSRSTPPEVRGHPYRSVSNRNPRQVHRNPLKSRTNGIQIDISRPCRALDEEFRARAEARNSTSEPVDATALATALLGDTIAANMMMLGFALQNGLLPLGVEAMERAITLNAVAVRFNLLAFRLGRLYATDPVRVRALLPPADKPAARTLDETINRQAQRLTQYQNAAYGGRYCALVQRVRDAERRVAPHSESLTTAAAQNYAKLLAYKDEYEVARMLSSAELLAELDKTFTRGGRYIFNLAPPIFGGRKISGRQRKRAFDARLMRPIFALMAKGKAVRGSPLDPFGWSTERRMERQLIVDYETLVQDVLRNLSAANHTAGVRLLTLVDSVRGFGPVKEAAIAAYQCAVIDAKAMFTGALAAQTGQAATAP